MTFKTLPREVGLRHDPDRAANGDVTSIADPAFVQEVVDRWRRAAVGRKLRVDDATPSAAGLVAGSSAEAPEPPSAAQRLDQARYQLLRR